MTGQEPVAECPECGQPVPATVSAGPVQVQTEHPSRVTADDVQDARRAWHRLPLSEKDRWVDEESFTADRLNRVVWGASQATESRAPERGDDERYCPQCDSGGHECSGCGTAITHKSGQACAACVAGSLPAMSPEVTEALTWLRENPDDIEMLSTGGSTLEGSRKAATVVRWVLSLSNGHSDTGERAASEQDDESRKFVAVPVAWVDHDEDDGDLHETGFIERIEGDNAIINCDCGPRRVTRPLSALTLGNVAADPSPRSWSLPAPPPDDVTVVHVGEKRFERLRNGVWWDGWCRETSRSWCELLGLGTVVEGEPQAAEPPDPEKDDAIAHMRVQDAIERRLRDHGAGYEDEPWFADLTVPHG